MIESYLFFLKNNKTGIFNVGFENYSISKIADMINKNLESVKIKKNSSIDVRSYRLYAGKILSIGFKKSKSSNDAITDIINNFNNKKIKDRKTNFRSIFLSKNLKKFYG